MFKLFVSSLNVYTHTRFFRNKCEKCCDGHPESYEDHHVDYHNSLQQHGRESRMKHQVEGAEGTPAHRRRLDFIVWMRDPSSIGQWVPLTPLGGARSPHRAAGNFRWPRRLLWAAGRAQLGWMSLCSAGKGWCTP